MEVLLKKDLDKSYVLIKPEMEIKEDYRLKMLYNNSIPGLNALSIKEFNNSRTLYYDVSGKASMEYIYLRNKMKAQDIRMFIAGIQRVLESIKEYILDKDKIIMEPEYIYINANNMPDFCYYPQKKEDFFESLQKVLNRIIELVDYADREAVIIAYGLQKMGTRENITMHELLKIVNGNNAKEKQSVEEQNSEVYERESTKSEVIKSEKNLEEDFGELFAETESIKRNIFKKLFGKIFPNIDRYKKINEIEQVTGFLDVEGKEEEIVLSKQGTVIFGIMLKATDYKEGKDIIPNKFPYIIGKNEENVNCVIENKKISRNHMRISEKEGQYYVEDLNSTNGTFVNGKKLKPYHLEKINLGDTITLSEIEYIVC